MPCKCGEKAILIVETLVKELKEELGNKDIAFNRVEVMLRDTEKQLKKAELEAAALKAEKAALERQLTLQNVSHTAPLPPIMCAPLHGFSRL
jgi:phage shock protein A